MTLGKRIAVIGAGGYMGGFYILKLLEMGIAASNILAVEIDDERRHALWKEYEGAICFYDDLASLEHENVDCAILALPAPLHARAIQSCIRYRIYNVFVEKPLVTDVSDLDLIRHPLARIYTGYLINFSAALDFLKDYVSGHNLQYVSIAGYWGKNWAAVDRPMGPDFEEEFPHPFVAARHLLETIDKTCSIATQGIFKTHVPYVRPELEERAKASGFSSELNDSAMGLFVATACGREVPISIVSSFNMTTQTRRMDFVLAKKGEAFQSLKAQIDFDQSDAHGNFDEIKIIDSRTNEVSEHHRCRVDKLQVQLRSVLNAFEHGYADSRLTDQSAAGEIVRFFAQSK